MPLQDKSVPVGCVVCERLRNLRSGRKNLTQKGLAKKIGIHFQTVSRLERSPSPVDTNTLVKLARFFDVPCGYLLGEEKVDMARHLQGDTEFVGEVARFLEVLVERQVHRPADMLKYLRMLAQADPSKVVEGRMADEEQAFGLWWSLLAAYERGNWDEMIRRAEQLKEVGEKVGRPLLVAVAHAYKAQALCRRDRDIDIDAAQKELMLVPRNSEWFESALVTRLRAKVLRRQGCIKEALSLCEKAQRAIESCERDDALYYLERVKLHRYLGVLHSRLARESKNDQDLRRHLSKAAEYFEECEKTLAPLKAEIPREGLVEKMLLKFAWARHAEIPRDFEQSLKYGKEALGQALENRDEDYATKVRMFLLHISILLENEKEALEHVKELMPLKQWKTGPLAQYYERWVKIHADELPQIM